MTSSNNIAVRVGLQAGLALTVLGVLFRIAGIGVASPLAIGFYALVAGVAWYAIRELRRVDARAGFTAELAISSYATLIAAAIYCLSVLLYNALIDAKILVEAEAYLRERAASAGLSGDALAAAYRQARILTQPLSFVIAVFFQLAITGLSTAVTIAGWRWYCLRSVAILV